MELLQEVEALKRVPLFAKLEPSKLKLLAFTSESLTFDEGEILFRAGDPADAAYVIMNGQVDILAETEAGEILAGTLEAGQLVGEMAVLTNEPRSATIVAEEPTRVLMLAGARLKEFVMQTPEMAFQIFSVLTTRIREVQQRLDQAVNPR